MKKKIYLFVLCLAALCWSGTAEAASFKGLGDLPGGVFESRADAISADGKVVVGRSDSGGHEAFRWTDSDGMVGLGYLPGDNESGAQGVSSDGSVVVGYSSTNTSTTDMPFRWTVTGGMSGLAPPSYVVHGSANDVSSDGSVVVGGYLGDESKPASYAFRWTQKGGMVDIALEAGAGAVSADGSVVVGTQVFAICLPFRWTVTGGSEVLDGFSEYGNSDAADVSANGVYIVGSSYNEGLDMAKAYRWTEADGVELLGDLPGGADNSRAWAVSYDGSVIVGTVDVPGLSGDRAFIWDPGNGMRLLANVLTDVHGIDLDGWTLTAATSISDDGKTIVGYGTNPYGNLEAWMANLEPDCPLELALAKSQRGGQSLKNIRSFRKQIMDQTLSGRRLASLYYKHSAELTKILKENPAIAARVGQAAIKYGPAIESLLDGSDGPVLARSDQKRIASLLSDLAKHANPELKTNLLAVGTQFKAGKSLSAGKIWERFEKHRW